MLTYIAVPVTMDTIYIQRCMAIVFGTIKLLIYTLCGL